MFVRHNYTTPKSFLELINLYVKILRQKHEELDGKSKRLGNGLEKLRVTAAQVGLIHTVVIKINKAIHLKPFIKQLFVR